MPSTSIPETATGEHPRRHLAPYGGFLQADPYAEFNYLYAPQRKPAPITEAVCLSHARRMFLILADAAKAPLPLEVVRWLDGVFAIEREINSASAEHHLAIRRDRWPPLVADPEAWMQTERARLSRYNDVAKAIHAQTLRRLRPHP